MENARGLGRHLAARLAATGERVVDVPPKLSARVRVLSTGNARKNDGIDALSTALAASRNERLAPVGPEADSEVLRLLSERREDLEAHDDELYGKVREHVDRDHPEMRLSDEQVAGLVAEGAYDK